MNDWVPVVGVIGVILAITIPVMVIRYLKYQIEIEKIKSQTEVKKEEVRAKNQYEIEKMLMEGKNGLVEDRPVSSMNYPSGDSSESMTGMSGKEKIKLD